MKQLPAVKIILAFIILLLIVIATELFFYQKFFKKGALFKPFSKTTSFSGSNLTSPSAGKSFGKMADKTIYSQISGLDYKGIIMPNNTYLSSLVFFNFKNEQWANAIVRNIDFSGRKIDLEISSEIKEYGVDSNCNFQINDLAKYTKEPTDSSLDPIKALRVKDYVTVRFEKLSDYLIINRLILYTNNFNERKIE